MEDGQETERAVQGRERRADERVDGVEAALPDGGHHPDVHRRRDQVQRVGQREPDADKGQVDPVRVTDPARGGRGELPARARAAARHRDWIGEEPDPDHDQRGAGGEVDGPLRPDPVCAGRAPQGDEDEEEQEAERVVGPEQRERAHEQRPQVTLRRHSRGR
jgi:hypothetical protein